MPRLALDGYECHYQQHGAGRDVVLVHGFTSNQAMWLFSGIVTTLAKEFRVTTYDLRGHGLSSAPPNGYTSDVVARDFRQLHERLGLGPAYIVGHSFGGVLAMQAALDEPQRVAGIILCDTYFPGLAHLEPNMGDAEIWSGLRSSFQAAGIEIGAAVDFRRLFDALGGLTDTQRSVLQEKLGAPGVRWLAQLGPLTATTAAEDVFQAAGFTAERICAVTQPVVALYDERTPFAATRDFLAARLPNCRVDTVPGSGHLALLENPAGFVDRVQANLRELAGI
ncbi:MAG: alpha/beta fold hydrolase [Pirellulales bacterium]